MPFLPDHRRPGSHPEASRVNCVSSRWNQHTEALAVIQETQAQHGELLAKILRRLGNSTSD
ncbi:MAG: hypothetical protein ACRDRR_07150 [Pseudonocardiaceae bacterium]